MEALPKDYTASREPRPCTRCGRVRVVKVTRTNEYTFHNNYIGTNGCACASRMYSSTHEPTCPEYKPKEFLRVGESHASVCTGCEKLEKASKFELSAQRLRKEAQEYFSRAERDNREK